MVRTSATTTLSPCSTVSTELPICAHAPHSCSRPTFLLTPHLLKGQERKGGAWVKGRWVKEGAGAQRWGVSEGEVGERRGGSGKVGRG